MLMFMILRMTLLIHEWQTKSDKNMLDSNHLKIKYEKHGDLVIISENTFQKYIKSGKE